MSSKSIRPRSLRRRGHRVPPARWPGCSPGRSPIGIGWLVAGIIEVRSPIDAVGTQVIDHAPVWLIDLGKQWFGTGDKDALRVGIYLILGVAAALLGIASVRRRWIGVVGIAAFGAVRDDLRPRAAR